MKQSVSETSTSKFKTSETCTPMGGLSKSDQEKLITSLC